MRKVWSVLNCVLQLQARPSGLWRPILNPRGAAGLHLSMNHINSDCCQRLIPTRYLILNDLSRSWSADLTPLCVIVRTRRSGPTPPCTFLRSVSSWTGSPDRCCCCWRPMTCWGALRPRCRPEPPPRPSSTCPAAAYGLWPGEQDHVWTRTLLLSRPLVDQFVLDQWQLVLCGHVCTSTLMNEEKHWCELIDLPIELLGWWIDQCLNDWLIDFYLLIPGLLMNWLNC